MTAGQEGLEPPTRGFGDRRSTNWSYWPSISLPGVLSVFYTTNKTFSFLNGPDASAYSSTFYSSDSYIRNIQAESLPVPLFYNLGNDTGADRSAPFSNRKS